MNEIAHYEQNVMDKKDAIYRILCMGETADIKPPYTCLPEGHSDWLSFKVDRIMALFEKADD